MNVSTVNLHPQKRTGTYFRLEHATWPITGFAHLVSPCSHLYLDVRVTLTRGVRLSTSVLYIESPASAMRCGVTLGEERVARHPSPLIKIGAVDDNSQFTSCRVGIRLHESLRT